MGEVPWSVVSGGVVRLSFSSGSGLAFLWEFPMNKSIFKVVEGYLQQQLGDKEVWSRVLMNAGVEPKAEARLDQETAEAILESAADLSGMAVAELLEAAGRFMAPSLLDRLQLRRPESQSWKSLDVLENLPDLLHGLDKNLEDSPVETRALRLRYGEAALVVLRPRGACRLVKGILLGVAEKKQEPLRMEEALCQWQGAMLCRFLLTLNDPVLSRQVDVRREFGLALEQEEEIRFFNRFQGVPVVSVGELLHVGHEEVEFRLPHEHLLALQMEEQTFMAIPHLTFGVVGQVKSVELADGRVVLRKLEATDGVVGMRGAERVEPLYPVIVECVLGDQVLRGQLVDISTGGLSLVVRQDAEIGEEDLFAPLVTHFKLQNTPPSVRRSGEKLKYSIRWMEGEGGAAQELSVAGNVLDVVKDNDVKMVRVVFSLPPEDVMSVLEGFVNERREAVIQSLATHNPA